VTQGVTKRCRQNAPVGHFGDVPLCRTIVREYSPSSIMEMFISSSGFGLLFFSSTHFVRLSASRILTIFWCQPFERDQSSSSFAQPSIDWNLSAHVRVTCCMEKVLTCKIV
jgi:hypothetical protein